MPREMKDSGIEWIGQIPINWNVVRVKDKYYFETGFTPNTAYPEYYSDENGYEWATIADIDKGRVLEPTKSLISRKFVNIKHKNPYQKGCLLYSFKLSVGQVAIVDRPVFTNEAIACFFPNDNISIPFFRYSSFLIEYGGQTNIYGAKILNQLIINNAYIVYPPLDEQKRIAEYLDYKCSKIDSLTNKIEEQIIALEEYKKSVIYYAICHGVEDKPLKETSSDVWDQIPNQWKLKPIKYLFEIVKRIAGEEGFDVLSVTQHGLRVKDITSGDGQLANNYSGYQFVYPSDYVMNHMDLLTGWVDLSSMFGVTSPDYRVFRLRNTENNSIDYYKYVMQCCYLNRIFYSFGQGVSNLGRWRLQTEVFKNFKVPVPPFEEQCKIAEYLDEKCLLIDEIIAKKQEQLDVLDEYKKSLIYEYVTGKKEVVNNE